MSIWPRKTSCRRGTLENRELHRRWVMRKSVRARRPWMRWKNERVVLGRRVRLKGQQGMVGFK